MTRRSVFAFLGTAIAAVASFRPLSALQRRPPSRGPCYRGSISWQPRGTGQTSVWAARLVNPPRTAAGPVRRGAADPTPLEVREVRDAPPGARLLLGRRTGAWSRNRPAGGRTPPRPHRRPGAHAPGSPVVRRRCAGRDLHLELGNLPGLDRPLARRAATPAGVGAASLPRRRPALTPDLVKRETSTRPKSTRPPYPSGGRDRRSWALSQPGDNPETAPETRSGTSWDVLGRRIGDLLPRRNGSSGLYRRPGGL